VTSGLDLDILRRYGPFEGETAIREGIRHRQRHCRMCAKEIDFSNDLGVRRQVRAIRYDDGKNRNELYAFCTRECERAYVRWEESR
jgi:hypothetical protein